jgi:ribosome-associated protein
MDLAALKDLAYTTLEDGKARDIQVLDVTGLSTFTDCMIVATGTSSTHVRALASMVDHAFKEAGDPSLGSETGPEPDWALIDHGNLIVHVMTESARAYYALEKLWDMKSRPSEPKNASEAGE